MVRYLSLVWLAGIVLTLSSSNALALPIGTSRDAEAARQAVADPNEIREAGVDFTAIVALSNCSGSLVRFNSSRAEDKAMILTNGHCLEGGMPKPGVVVVNKASSRSFTLLKSTGVGSITKLSATKVLYATMTNTDMALYQLSASYEEIQSKHNVQALTLSDRRADIAAPIRVVSG